MTSLTLCPQCQKPVGVPGGTHPSAQVRCPLCEAEFTLGESVPDDLAEVVVIDPGFVAASAAGEAAQLDQSLERLSSGATSPDEAGDFMGLLDGSATDHDGEDVAFAEADEETATSSDAEGSETEGEETALFEGALSDESDAEDEEISFDPFGSDEKQDDAAEAAEGDAATALADDESAAATAEGEEAESEEDAEGFDFSFGQSVDEMPDFAGAGAGPEADEEGGQSIAATLAQPKPKKGLGFKGQLVGIVVFGVIGLALGYGILKLIKPAAAAPIDNIIGSAWSSVASLWGGGAADDTSSSADDDAVTKNDDGSSTQNSGSFVIGSMRKDGQQPPPPLDMTPKTDEAKSPDDAAAGSDGGVDNNDNSAPPDTVEETRPFIALLGNRPDAEGVFQEIDPNDLDEKFAGAMTASSEISSAGQPTPKQRAAAFFSLCDLGHLLAFVADPDDPRTQVQLVDAENLVRDVVKPQEYASFGKFGRQWLQFDKRPPAYKDKQGVLLVGKAQRIVELGPYFASEIELEPGPDAKRIIVLTIARPDFHVHDMAGVLGSVVRDAVIKLPGYDPSDALKEFSAEPSTIVLSTLSIKLPKED